MKRNKLSRILDYSIGFMSILILMLGTFSLPSIYSSILDKNDFNKVRRIEREQFSFSNPIGVTVSESVQRMMEALEEKSTLSRALTLSQEDLKKGEIIERLREALEIVIQYNMLPNIRGYDFEKYMINAEYYNLATDPAEGMDKAFWVLRFSDQRSFDFTFRMDASEYIIYQAEVYCKEVDDCLSQINSDDKEVASFYNEQFINGSALYFEAEGYSNLVDMSEPNQAVMLGYERGEYVLFQTPCSFGFLNKQGLRWGFVPMTVALEKGTASKEWNFKGIEAYFYDLYQINVYKHMEE